MDKEKIEEIANGVADGVNKIISASEALQLMKRCTDEDLGSITLSQRQCEAIIWMIKVLREGPSDG